MKLIRLTVQQGLILALIAIAGFGLSQILHYTVNERAVRFAVFIPSVLLMLLLFFRIARPNHPFDLALTLSVILDAMTAVAIIVKDFIIDHNYTPRVIILLFIVAAAPFIAASVYYPFRKK